MQVPYRTGPRPDASSSIAGGGAKTNLCYPGAIGVCAAGAAVKRRIDLLLVERGLAPTRERALALLMAGQVLVGERLVTKPGALVPEDATLFLKQQLPYVGRGGLKLAHALEHFHLDVRGAVALDVGASTGGFTDCLLKHGAARVYAVDVGYGQLDLSLRTDPRVRVLERVNARYPFPLPERVSLATVDVSFISLTKVLAAVAEHVIPGGFLLPLLKPQFEAEREEVSKGGVIRDPALHARVLGRFLLWVVGRGWRLRGLTASPILGDAINREFFFLLQTPAPD
ncbi:MAG: TlyA family RNA methyltransferase [Dehalococcoidia bacterium]|nr:TlyA family RNA methyltransferase [Dehalococcoidia bacterium]